MSDQIVMNELVGATLTRFEGDPQGWSWYVDFLCVDGETRSFEFNGEAIAEGFVLTYCESTNTN